MLPGDFSKAHAVANFQTFPISDRTREIIVLNACKALACQRVYVLCFIQYSQRPSEAGTIITCILSMSEIRHRRLSNWETKLVHVASGVRPDFV